VPDECPFCDGEGIWLDGWRLVYCVVLLDGTPHRFDDGLPLQRVVCTICHVSWTLHPAFLYPHRSLEPDVMEAAGLKYLSDPASTYEKTAKDHGCSPRSVWVTAARTPSGAGARGSADWPHALQGARFGAIRAVSPP
jgi:hypothetical protein